MIVVFMQQCRIHTFLCPVFNAGEVFGADAGYVSYIANVGTRTARRFVQPAVRHFASSGTHSFCKIVHRRMSSDGIIIIVVVVMIIDRFV